MQQVVRTTTRFAYENTFRREMLRHLTPAETKVMVYIIDKTLGWMKDRERISMYEIKDGKGNNRGTRISRSTVIKCVDGLVRKGIIFIQDTCKKLGTLMVINLDWSEEQVLNEPKQAKKQSSKLSSSLSSSTNVGLHMSENTTTGSTRTVPPINKENKSLNKLDYERQAFESGTLDIDSNFEEEDKVILQPVSKPLSVQEAIDSGKRKQESAVDKKRQRNLERAKTGGVNVSILESTFVDGINANDEKLYVKSWSMKDKGQAKHLIKALNMSSTVMLEFAFFCGQYWKQIIRDKFQWADGELSNMPNIGFLLKYTDQFLYAFNNKDKIAQAEAKSSVGGRVARMVERGMTEEEALEDIDNRMAKRGKVRARKRATTANQIDDYHRQITRNETPVVKAEPTTKRKAYIPEDMEMLPLDLPEMGDWK